MALAGDINFDGRRMRSQRTRADISNALLQLLEEGHHDPPAQQVAKRASVSVRSLYHHFNDMENLYLEVVEFQAQRVVPLLAAASGHRSTLSRARHIVELHDDLYSITAPLHNGVRFSTAARGSKRIGEILSQLRQATSTHIQRSFDFELSRHDNPYDLTCRLQAVMSFEMWDHFRRVQGCSRHATRSHMLALLMTELEA